MNINYQTYIKQEILNAEDELNTTLPFADLNIPVKNEPISDDILPLVTIKKEPLNEAATLTEATGYNIKNEVAVQTKGVSIPGDSFIIYELETPLLIPNHIQQVDNLSKGKQIINEATQSNNLTNSNQLNSLAVNSVQSILAKQNEPSGVSPKVTITSPPVLLNDKLRKRSKVVVPVNLIEKRTRYNIEGAIVHAKNITTPAATTSLNGGGKKIINHLIKNKRNQRKLEDHTLKSLEPSIALDNENFCSENKKVPNDISSVKIIDKACARLEKRRVDLTTNEINTPTQMHFDTNLNTSSPAPTTSSLGKDLNTTKEIFNTPELRVKCLCSLTHDISNDSSSILELRDFFQKMFEKTRKLNKKQQRKIKKTLLQIILDAEESVEQGKCCSF